jgi:hypothetical protein
MGSNEWLTREPVLVDEKLTVPVCMTARAHVPCCITTRNAIVPFEVKQLPGITIGTWLQVDETLPQFHFKEPTKPQGSPWVPLTSFAGYSVTLEVGTIMVQTPWSAQDATTHSKTWLLQATATGHRPDFGGSTLNAPSSKAIDASTTETI